MVEVTVIGLSLDAETRSPMLILRERDTNTILPIWIGAMEALSISLALGKVPMPRPLTHELMLNAFTKLNASLVSVRIYQMSQGVFYSELDILSGGKNLKLDARPSDAVALALRVDAPILVPEKMLRHLGQIVRIDELTRNLRMASGDLALLFSTTQERELNRSSTRAFMPDDIFADANHVMQMRRQRKMQKEAANEQESRTWPDASSVDLTNQQVLDELILSLSPESKYKM